jgi:predicted ferric reductase
VDQYKNYVKNLQDRGMQPTEIREILAKNGYDDATINRLVPIPATSMTVDEAFVSSSPQQTSRISSPEAYVDYVKALLARGMTADQVSSHLEEHDVSGRTVKAILDLIRQSAVPQNYPSTPSLKSGRPMGQAPAAVSSLSSEASTDNPTHTQIGWLLVIICCLLPSLFIMFDAPGRFSNSIQTLLTLSNVSAVIGLCLYVIDMLLATRMAIIEDWFGGLNKVYIAHAIIGSAALTAILLHPVLLAIRYAPLGMRTVAGFFIPSTKYIPSAFGIVALALMLILLIITFYAHLPYKIWLSTHKYLGLAYILICVHVLFTPNVITNNLFVRLYLIVFLILGLAAFVYRTLLPNIFVRRYVYIVQAAEERTKGMVEVTLSPTTKAIKFQAGQFVFVSFHADGLSPEWHPFTVSSPPGTESLSIALKSLGGYTETLTRLLPDMVGMSVLIEGAYGRFSFRNFKNLNQVWVAGGIGITPFLSMAQKLESGPYNIDLYYAVRSEAELVDLDKLVAVQRNEPGKVFRVFPFVTEKYNRHLSADLIASNSSDFAQRDFLICGPPAMMNGLKNQLRKMGVKKFKIHTEDFSIT